MTAHDSLMYKGCHRLRLGIRALIATYDGYDGINTIKKH